MAQAQNLCYNKQQRKAEPPRKSPARQRNMGWRMDNAGNNLLRVAKRVGPRFAAFALTLAFVGAVVGRACADSNFNTKQPAATGTVFPGSGKGSAPGSMNPRVIRLAHNGASNGRLLATFQNFQTYNFGVYLSTNDGASWAATPMSVVSETHLGGGWHFFGEPSLLELPQAVGALPAGTILLAGSSQNFNPFQQQIEVYASGNGGMSWRYLSTVETRSPGGPGGIWEPCLQIAGNGSLVVYYSDERQKAQNYNQLLAHRSSPDGLNWSAEVYDVAVPDNTQRPGMAIVQKLPNGQYLMSFEDVGGGAGSPMRVKLSADGLNWGNPADIGSIVQTSGGAYLGATPYIFWTPAGGPNGMVIASASFLNNSPNSDRELFVNYNLGQGVWQAMPAPVQWQGGNPQAGWSAAMLDTADHTGLIHFAPSDTGGGVNEIRYATAPLILPGGTYSLTNVASGLCLDVVGQSAAPNAKTQQTTYTGAASQRWRVDYVAPGTYKLTNLNSGLCLDDPAGSSQPGTILGQWRDNGLSPQQWLFQLQSDGAYTLTNLAANLNLDDPGGSNAPNTPAQLWTANTAMAQHWRLTKLADAPVTLSGTAALEGCANLAQTVTFTFRPTDGGAVFTRPVTLTSGGAFSLPSIPRKNYQIHVKGALWLAQNLMVDATQGDAANLSLSLRAGDANNDNFCDASDFGILVGAYSSDSSKPGSGYDPTADFNCDGFVDTTDFGLLVGNYGQAGDL